VIVTVAIVGVLILAAILISFFFHVHTYSKLLESIKARGLNISGLEPEFFDYGSRGFMGKLKLIESKYLLKGALSKEEETMLTVSKRAYYAMAPFLLGFMVVLALVLIKA
jgi:hypothetical protein